MPSSGATAACDSRPVYCTREVRDRADARVEVFERRRVHHHRRVHAVERAAFEHEDLAAAALFGRRADDRDRDAELVDERREREPGADGGRGDDVVPARVPDARQRVVLRADREVQRAVADAAARTRSAGRRSPASTGSPASASTPAVHALDCSSSNFSSGCAWMRWLSPTSRSRVARRRSSRAGGLRVHPGSVPPCSTPTQRCRADRAPERTALLVDFDGSLAPIVDRPERRGPLPACADVLGRLAAGLGRVGIVSGRPVEFLARHLPVAGLVLVGLYGMEQSIDGDYVGRPARRALSRRGRGRGRGARGARSRRSSSSPSRGSASRCTGDRRPSGRARSSRSRTRSRAAHGLAELRDAHGGRAAAADRVDKGDRDRRAGRRVRRSARSRATTAATSPRSPRSTAGRRRRPAATRGADRRALEPRRRPSCAAAVDVARRRARPGSLALLDPRGGRVGEPVGG